MSSADPSTAAKRVAAFNYLSSSIPPSLYRTGRVFVRRRPDGTDAEMTGYEADTRSIRVEDARTTVAAQGGLHINGFELVEHRLEDPSIDFLDHEQIVRRHYPECQALLQDVTGAAHVFAFDHNVRWAPGEREKRQTGAGQQVQKPIRLVHGDYTLTSAPQRLRDLASPLGTNDTLRPFLKDGQTLVSDELVDRALGNDGRFAIINLWRNIAETPVLRDPLGFCDAQTIRPEDLVVFELHYTDRIGENYLARWSDRHRWYFFSEVTRDEVALIKQWDSAGGLASSKGERSDTETPECPCSLNFHSAFEDPLTPPEAPDRASIEVRCVAIY